MDLLLPPKVIFSLSHTSLELVHLSLSSVFFYFGLFLQELRFVCVENATVLHLLRFLERHVYIDNGAAYLKLSEHSRENLELFANQDERAKFAQVIL